MVVFFIRAEYPTARDLAELLLTLAHREQTPDYLQMANKAMGVTLHFLGEFAPAREHLEQGLTLSHSQEHQSRAGREQEVPCQSFAAWNLWLLVWLPSPSHQEIACRSCAALSLWFLGYPDQALQRSHEALSLARELADPYVLADALGQAAAFHLLRKEGQIAQERAEQCIALCTEHGFALYLAVGTMQRGHALARQGHGEEGIALIRQGLTAVQATGAEVARSHVLGVLAEMYGEVGRAAEGLSLLAEALTHVHTTGERFYEAELYRLAGELSLRMGERETGRKGDKKVAHSPTLPFALSSPEACFHKAIEVARQQSAKSWELRAVMSLSRLWQRQGKKKAARKLLAEIYGWFTEGFDTVDLQEAKALLGG